MTEVEDYIVQNPYQPTEKERLAIEELANKGLDSGDWNSKKTGIKEFKDHISDHMYFEQNCRCAYCRIELSNANTFLQREHIIPKAPHPQWMFEPHNLCITCEKCNNYKGDKEVLRNQYAVAYPTDSKDFLIVNPFLDKYSDHIELRDGIVYVGKTKKGCFTIDTCKLFMPDLALERAKIKMETDKPDTIRTQLLALLPSLPIGDKEKRKTLERFEKIVKIYKLKHRD